MHQPVVETIELTGPVDLMKLIQRATGREADVPDRDVNTGDEGDDEDKGTLFVVQLVLARPCKNHVEAGALCHVLGEMDGATGTPDVISVVMGNPLDDQADVTVTHTFTVFTIYAGDKAEAERVITEAVTETVPAPFDIAAVRLTEVAKRADEDRGRG